MLRKRLNLKEKLGSMLKRGSYGETGEDNGDDDVAASGQELKVEAAGDESLGSSWLEGEKEIFELQLGQLEEQLTASWMKNQVLGDYTDTYIPCFVKLSDTLVDASKQHAQLE